MVMSVPASPPLHLGRSGCVSFDGLCFFYFSKHFDSPLLPCLTSPGMSYFVGGPGHVRPLPFPVFGSFLRQRPFVDVALSCIRDCPVGFCLAVSVSTQFSPLMFNIHQRYPLVRFFLHRSSACSYRGFFSYQWFRGCLRSISPRSSFTSPLASLSFHSINPESRYDCFPLVSDRPGPAPP